MSGHSTHRYHQADRCRSPRSRRGSDNESTIILPDVVVNVLEEEEDDILKRLQRPFTDIRVKRRNSKLTFIGSDQNRADAMMFVYRYLSHVKRVECIRLRDEASEVRKNSKSKNPRGESSRSTEPARVVRFIDPEPRDGDAHHLRVIEHLKKELKEKEEEIEVSKSSLDDAITEIKNLTSNLEEARKENKAMTVERSDLVVDLTASKTALGELERELQDKRGSISSLKMQNEETETKLKQQEEQMRIMSKMKQEKSQCDCSKTLEEEREKLQGLEESLNEERKKLRDLGVKYNEKKIMIFKLENKLLDCINERDKLKKEIERDKLKKRNYREYIELSDDENS